MLLTASGISPPFMSQDKLLRVDGKKWDPASRINHCNFHVKFVKGQHCALHTCSQFLNTKNHQTSQKYSIKVPIMALFGEPTRAKIYVDKFRERLWEAFPVSLKEFPWKKAENIFLQQLLILGEKALKWSLVTLFIASSLSDMIFSISRNKELMMPIGLFVGCLMADFFKETLQELFPSIKEGNSSWHLLGISSFFVLVKLISMFFTVRGQVFLSHVGNGGLLQILWLCKNLQDKKESGTGDEKSSSEDAHLL